MKIVARLTLLAFMAALMPVHAGQEPGKASTAEVYNFAELVARAERIVAAEVGPAKDGVISLVVKETIKAPEQDAKYVDPERLKRAADLLANDKLNLPPVTPTKAPVLLKVKLNNVPAPKEGIEAVFFLWEKDAGSKEPVYVLSHPQNVYDAELLPQVRAGTTRPRTIADGRFLRDWDKLLAERKKQRDAHAALLQSKGGEPVLGLRIKLTRPQVSLRGNNSFGVTAVIENTRGRDQEIYDGPAGGYGIILRPKEANSPIGNGIVLRQSTKQFGVDTSVLNITDMTDFTTVPKDNSISKELFFDAQDHGILTSLSGEFTVSVFFTTAHDGKGLQLDSPVWTGTMISEEVPIRFNATAAKAK